VLLAVFYGAALGNVVRGVPIDTDGYFFLSLWANMQPGSDPGVIDWYTVLAGLTALVTLAIHGALWVALKTEGDLQARCNVAAQRLWLVLLPLVLLISAASFLVQPLLHTSFEQRPWEIVFPVLAGAGLAGLPFFIKRHESGRAFLSSCAMILGLLCSTAAGLYPNLLPSNTDAARSLTIANVSAPNYGLQVGLFWFVPAFGMAIAYSAFVYRHSAGKVRLESQGH
jgi:cytochrome d ubiquinol oxidase subunit II